MPDGSNPLRPLPEWDGRSYYGRQQLKPAPFNNALVGTYVFLAGLSGAAQVLSTLIDLTHGRRAGGTVRRGRFLSLLAPTVGALGLITDLHTPQRFYNMLRVFKTTSPMSFGSWILVGFGAGSTLTAAAQLLADHVTGFSWMRRFASVTQMPAALAGAGIATYTASLFSATSSPRWAAAPRSLAVRFAASAIASGAAALSLVSRHSRVQRDLDGIAVAALTAELAATLGGDAAEHDAGIPGVPSSTDLLSAAVPIGLYCLSLLLPRRSATLSSAAACVVLGGSLAMRIGVMRRGEESARDPLVSMRFAQPDNLP